MPSLTMLSLKKITLQLHSFLSLGNVRFPEGLVILLDAAVLFEWSSKYPNVCQQFLCACTEISE